MFSEKAGSLPDLEVGPMSVRSPRTPSYRKHKPTGQAVVTLSGRDFYLGRYGSRESRSEYDRLIAEWLTSGRELPGPTSGNGSDLTVNEMLLAFEQWAESYYRKGGEITGEVTNVVSVRPIPSLTARADLLIGRDLHEAAC
jgi:hypothetical protein